MKSIVKVESDHQIKQVEELALKIWNQHFVDLIGQAQVDYMLKKFQSVPAISSQIQSGYEYYLLSVDDLYQGYFSICSNNPQGTMFLSKIYIDQFQRGSGLGLYILDFIKTRCRDENQNSIRLTVYKKNDNTILWYKKRGFTIVEEVENDIGQGFIMDDFIMQLELEK